MKIMVTTKKKSPVEHMKKRRATIRKQLTIGPSHYTVNLLRGSKIVWAYGFSSHKEALKVKKAWESGVMRKPVMGKYLHEEGIL